MLGFEDPMSHYDSSIRRPLKDVSESIIDACADFGAITGWPVIDFTTAAYLLLGVAVAILGYSVFAL